MFIRKLTQQVICDHDQAFAHTQQGRLRGIISDNTYVFRGIAYARAERFHMPEPIEPWEGVREAIPNPQQSWGESCALVAINEAAK